MFTFSLQVAFLFPNSNWTMFVAIFLLIRAPPLGGCPIVITLSVCQSVCLSVRQKTLTLAITFLLLQITLFIFGMCDPYDKTFPMVP